MENADNSEFKDNHTLDIKEESFDIELIKRNDIKQIDEESVKIKDDVTIEENFDMMETSTAELDNDGLNVKKAKSIKKVKAPQPPTLASSVSSVSLVGPAEHIVHL